jgi:hypothetical protein
VVVGVSDTRTVDARERAKDVCCCCCLLLAATAITAGGVLICCVVQTYLVTDTQLISGEHSQPIAGFSLTQDYVRALLARVTRLHPPRWNCINMYCTHFTWCVYTLLRSPDYRCTVPEIGIIV